MKINVFITERRYTAAKQNSYPLVLLTILAHTFVLYLSLDKIMNFKQTLL